MIGAVVTFRFGDHFDEQAIQKIAETARARSMVCAPMSASPAALASIALIGFWLIELFLRKGSSARSWRTSAADRGSTVAIVLVYIFVAAALTVQVRGPRWPSWAQWLGSPKRQVPAV